MTFRNFTSIGLQKNGVYRWGEILEGKKWIKILSLSFRSGIEEACHNFCFRACCWLSQSHGSNRSQGERQRRDLEMIPFS